MNNKILFLCTGNSCRSQMAEGIARNILPNNIRIKSAGTHPCGMNLDAINSMNEILIDISQHTSKKIEPKDLDIFELIITLCRDAKDTCPTFTSKNKHIHWDIEDPTVFKGSKEELKNKYSEVRDIIYNKIAQLKFFL